MKTHQEVNRKVTELLSHNPEALDFIILHNAYVHTLDDVVDEPLKCVEKVNIALMSWRYYNHPYYIKHANSGLSMLCFLNYVDYKDSVSWELSGEQYKVQAAKTLRHGSISMLFAVIAIECGADIAAAWSTEFRESTFLNQDNDIEFKGIVTH